MPGRDAAVTFAVDERLGPAADLQDLVAHRVTAIEVQAAARQLLAGRCHVDLPPAP